MPEPTLAAQVGARLGVLRRERGETLATVARHAGLDPSVLSRLENGRRQPTLEHLLALARHFDTPLDVLVGDEPRGDPAVFPRTVLREGMTLLPLTHRPGGVQAYKVIYPPASVWGEPRPRAHEGFMWCCVLAGRLRFVLEGQEQVLGPGDAVEYDTAREHWLGSALEAPAEAVVMFSAGGLQLRVRRPGA